MRPCRARKRWTAPTAIRWSGKTAPGPTATTGSAPRAPGPARATSPARFCESRATRPQVLQRDGASAAVYEEIAADVFATRDWILLFGFLVAAAFGFAYLVVLQIPFLLFAWCGSCWHPF